MILSFRHNYIYFPKKMGSSTIVEMLRASLGDEDISGTECTAKASRQSYMNAADVKPLVSPFWRRAFKFASERHPYEKAVSLAFSRVGKQQQQTRDKTPKRSRMIYDLPMEIRTARLRPLTLPSA